MKINKQWLTIILIIIIAIVVMATVRAPTMKTIQEGDAQNQQIVATSTDTLGQIKIQATTTSSVANLVGSAVFDCDGGKSIDARFYSVGQSTSTAPNGMPISYDTVVLDFNDGKTLTLLHAVSADGARYANPDESFVFWAKGDGAMVLENGEQKNYLNCIADTAGTGYFMKPASE